jgi:hypothetical protein
MRIEQIPLTGVRAGKTWRLINPKSRFGKADANGDVHLEKLGPVEEVEKPERDDFVIYSALMVCADGRVKPLLMIKELGSPEYGDYLEFSKKGWHSIEPDPESDAVDEFIANPDSRDPHFNSNDQDLRRHHREGFKLHASKIK